MFGKHTGTSNVTRDSPLVRSVAPLPVRASITRIFMPAPFSLELELSTVTATSNFTFEIGSEENSFRSPSIGLINPARPDFLLLQRSIRDALHNLIKRQCDEIAQVHQ
jgi:hypothetical protein